MTIPRKAQILIVDDYPTNIKVLSDLLIEYGFEVLIARDGENALQKLQRISPDIVLLDVLMPGIDGFETCRRIKEQESTRDIPIIFMTALADPVDKIKGLTMGAVDYITKPFQQEEVLARVNTHLKLRRLTKQLEEQNAQLQEEARSRQLAESALRSSEEKFAKAFRSNPGPMMILTLKEGRFLEINQNFCRILDYPPEEVLGKTIHDLNLCHSREACDRFLAAIQQTGMVHNYECQFYSRSGDIKTMLVSAEVIHVNDLPCILAMTLDITTCKQAATELQQAKAAADVANQAKSQFLATISHELRTPLNTILGYTQLMSRDSSLNREQHEHLSVINQSGEHLLTLINDVLEMTKIESGQINLYETDLNLFTLLNAIYEMLKPKAVEKGLQFLFDYAPDVPTYICTDATKLRQVLINIIGNGIKFTHQGSVTLRVRSSVIREDLTDNSHSLSESNECDSNTISSQKLIFDVIDTGSGIAPEELELLFDPFIQTESGLRSQEGTGLGLPISQRFVQLMGGSITVNSTVGQGSIFTIEIPIALAKPIECPNAQPKQRVIGLAPDQPNYRILVVDDQTANRQLLVKLLTSVGFNVEEAVNGEEAIALYQTWAPDLVWMDIRMPVMDGYEATQRIKQMQLVQSNSRAKIIALTANSFEDERVAALAAGYDDFVRKPIQEDRLFEKMTEHLGVRYIYQDITVLSTSATIAERSSESVKAFVIDDDIRESLQELVGDDTALLAAYIADLLNEFPNLIQNLRNAIRDQNAAAISLAAHSLKGVALTFRAKRLVELCQIVELKANVGIVAIAPEEYLQLERELEQLIAALEHEF